MKWLATLPSTNAVVLTGIVMALATCVRVLLNSWEPPDGWFLFVLAFAGVATTQFGVKRATQKDVPPSQNGSTP